MKKAALRRMQNLRTASFTVTFDANGGTSDELSRVIVYGTACGELRSHNGRRPFLLAM